MFEFVKNTNRYQSLSYICHSIGCAEILIYLSEMETTSLIIDKLIFFSPIVFMGNSSSKGILGLLEKSIDGRMYSETKASGGHIPWFASSKCASKFCSDLAAEKTMMQASEIDFTNLPSIWEHFYQGSSTKIIFVEEPW